MTTNDEQLRAEIMKTKDRLDGRQRTHMQVARHTKWTEAELHNVLREDQFLYEDEIIALFKADKKQAVLAARIDERQNTNLPFTGDHSQCIDKHTCIGYQNAESDLYNENLIRIAALQKEAQKGRKE